MANKKNEVYIGGEYLNIQTAQIVETRNVLKLKTSDNDYVNLEIKITADFNTIPEKYHEVFMNMISVKYMDSVSFGDNPFSQCIPPIKKRWWQFWKTSVNI